MQIENLLASYKEALSIGLVDKDAGNKIIDDLVNDFNKNYNIVSKDFWYVTFNSSDFCSDISEVQGPFISIEEAELFKKTWYERRDEKIKEYLKDNPNDESVPSVYLNIVPLKFTSKNQELLDEIRKTLGE